MRRVARASYGATTAPLGATKRPNWRESPKIAFRGARVFTNRATSAELAPTGRASTAPRIFLTARTAFESKSPAGEIFLQPFEFENLKGGFHPSSDQNHPPAGSLFHP